MDEDVHQIQLESLILNAGSSCLNAICLKPVTGLYGEHQHDQQ